MIICILKRYTPMIRKMWTFHIYIVAAEKLYIYQKLFYLVVAKTCVLGYSILFPLGVQYSI